MKTREDYDEDMQVLWHIMEKGAKNNKKSVDVMLVKIRELNNGSFIGSLPCSFWSVSLRSNTSESISLPFSTQRKHMTEDISYIGCNMSFDRNLAILTYITKRFKYTKSESMVESRTIKRTTPSYQPQPFR